MILYVKNGMIHDAIHEEAFRGDILVENGKIKAIGENLKIPENAEVIEAEGLQVYPGFVEAHGHIGLDGYGIGYEGMGSLKLFHPQAGLWIITRSCSGIGFSDKVKAGI